MRRDGYLGAGDAWVIPGQAHRETLIDGEGRGYVRTADGWVYDQQVTDAHQAALREAVEIERAMAAGLIPPRGATERAEFVQLARPDRAW